MTRAQDASVEKSVFGVQLGVLGIFGHNESKLSNSIALRSELGYEAGLFFSGYDSNLGFIMAPAITLEPRWYYNLNRRIGKSKRIDGNSGNFISIKTTYHPDILVISSQDNINLISDISFVPTYGIRRNIGAHFNYEFGFGIGYAHLFREENVFIVNQSDVSVNLHARFGYRF